MSNRKFDELGLNSKLLKAISDEGYTEPTPIQAAAIPYLREGRDLLGCAQTGTGKTAAFALPILNWLGSSPRPLVSRSPRVLVLTPTRELAAQIDESFRAYSRYMRTRTTVVFGGVGQNQQVRALSRGVDILVATPGRLLDLMEQGHIKLNKLDVFVLDEADRMLDMGFIHDVRKVIKALPAKRQSLFFSATMPPEIVRLAGTMLTDPAKVEVTPPATTVERINQQIMFVEKSDKRRLLTHILNDPEMARVLVFTRTKHGANRVVRQLDKDRIEADAIHGNKSQTSRTRALENFRKGKTRVLVATDIAARGIDVDGITHVINYDLPNIPDSYVHRIGRTARAGCDGVAISFCDTEERKYLKDIERLIRLKVPVTDDHPWHAHCAPAPSGKSNGNGSGAKTRRTSRNRRIRARDQKPGNRGSKQQVTRSL
jgi:ATP-dependent RNA helicase RhlE